MQDTLANTDTDITVPLTMEAVSGNNAHISDATHRTDTLSKHIDLHPGHLITMIGVGVVGIEVT